MKKWGTRLKHIKIRSLVSTMMVALVMSISKFMREIKTYHSYRRQSCTVAMCTVESWLAIIYLTKNSS